MLTDPPIDALRKAACACVCFQLATVEASVHMEIQACEQLLLELAATGPAAQYAHTVTHIDASAATTSTLEVESISLHAQSADDVLSLASEW